MPVRLEVKRQPRGQALVLAAVSMLILALMIALSFNLSHALHEKMRLQQHSDALAYSMGIVEARSFNYFAASNRAIAASLVAMNTLHADMAAASVTPEMMGAAQDNFYVIAGEEFALCPPWHFPHCVHGVQAIRIASKFGKAKRTYARKVKAVDPAFERAVSALDLMVDAIHASQSAVLVQTAQALRSGTGAGLDRLKQVNAPEASDLAGAVGILNAGALNCAIDGSPLPCVRPGAPADTSRASHGELLTAVANASRPDWPANRGTASIPYYLDPGFLQDLMHGIQGSGISLPFNHRGTAKTIQGMSQSELHGGQSSGDTGATSGADEHGWLLSQFKDGAFVWSYGAEVYSNKGGGRHSPSSVHSGRHRFEGTYAQSLAACLGMGNCFIKFRSDPDPAHDYGQPPVYSYVTQKLRAGDVKKAPWQLNDQASLTFTGPDGEDGTLHLAAGDGAAVSKALVYFHRIGSWRDPPNFFEPYWRVKLHPFTQTEIAAVLTAAGNTDAAQLSAVPTVVF